MKLEFEVNFREIMHIINDCYVFRIKLYFFYVAFSKKVNVQMWVSHSTYKQEISVLISVQNKGWGCCWLRNKPRHGGPQRRWERQQRRGCGHTLTPLCWETTEVQSSTLPQPLQMTPASVQHPAPLHQSATHSCFCVNWSYSMTRQLLGIIYCSSPNIQFKMSFVAITEIDPDYKAEYRKLSVVCQSVYLLTLSLWKPLSTRKTYF